MTITINCQLVRAVECSFDVTDQQLDVMVAHGVDVRDEWEVAEFYRKHVGEKVGDVRFLSLDQVWDFQHTGWPVEVDDQGDGWYAEGEAPDRFWPTEDAD